ncbi:MAG: hypothetical protein LQ340_006315 [Diploschistes diacapsis]|nr:MAG: hypothetical protein LQ340_006315 [Diploschistes diacapsis]
MTELVAPPTADEVFAVGVVWAPACTAVVILRFVVRRYQRTNLQADDWLTIPALLGTLGVCAAMIYGSVTQALGYPTPESPNGQDPLTFQNFDITTTKIVVWTIELLQCPALACTKMSCLFFYLRIFYTGQNQRFRYLTLTLIVITSLWGLVFFIALLTECNGHISAWWTDIETLDTYCKSSLAVEAAFAVSDTAMDLVILVVPVFMVRLILPATDPLSRSSQYVFWPKGGCCYDPFTWWAKSTVAASITRMIIFVQAVVALKLDYASSGANDTIPTTGVYWATIESGLALTAACLPSFYFVFKDAFKRIISSTRSSKPRSSSIFTKKRLYAYRGRWPFSNLGTTDQVNKTAVQRGHPQINDGKWYMHDEIPMISDLPRAAVIETHSTAAGTGSLSEGEVHIRSPPAMGQIRVENQIEQTQDIL